MNRIDQPSFSKIYVLYGRGVQSGGNLAAIQLVHKIRRLGGNAFLFASPGTENWTPVEQYEGLDAPEATFEDSQDNLLIISEYSFKLGARVENAHLAVWWLSADKSVPFRVISAIRSRNPREIRKVFGSRVLNGDLWAFVQILLRRKPSRTTHFAQSVYAQARIRKAFGVTSQLLGDYLYPPIANAPSNDHARTCHKTITYNAKKGGSPKILKLIPQFADWNWVPIAGVTPDQAISLLQNSCGFIDLGTLPGRDRLPREARAAGTPIAIARRGAGAFFEDFPIDERFRIDLQGNWELQVKNFLDGLCYKRHEYLQSQDPLMDSINTDEKTFEEQIRTCFTLGIEKT